MSIRPSPGARLLRAAALLLLGLSLAPTGGCDRVKEMVEDATGDKDGGDDKGDKDEKEEAVVHDNPVEAPPVMVNLSIREGEVSIIAVKNGDTEVPAKLSGVRGDLTFRDGKKQQGLSGSVVIDLRSFDSGLEARDANVKEVFFDVAGAPEATFQLTALDGVPADGIAIGYDTPATATGKLTLHGTTIDVLANVRLARSGESEYHVNTTEPVVLSVGALQMTERLKLLMTRCEHKSVDDNVRVTFRLDLGPRSAAPPPPPERVQAPVERPATKEAQAAHKEENTLHVEQDGDGKKGKSKGNKKKHK